MTKERKSLRTTKCVAANFNGLFKLIEMKNNT